MSRSASFLVAAGAGLGAGLAARLLFEILPEPWGTLANTSALWGLVPFLVAFGIRTRGWMAGAVGILSLAPMVAIWALLSPSPVTARELVMWTAIAIVAGVVCGVSGGLARQNRVVSRVSALALIGGIVAGEAVYGIVLIGGPQWWFELAIGLAVPIALGRTWRHRLLSVLGASVIAGLLFGAFVLYDAIAIA